MNIKDVRRQLYRVQNITGWTEKTEVLTDELQGLDRHVDNIRETCHVAEKKIRGVLRTEGSENDKKIKKLPEHALGLSLYEASKYVDSGLNSILMRCGLVEQQLAWEMAKSDEVVERDVLEPLKGILDNDIPALQKLRKTLSKLTTDMDIASNRYSQASKQYAQPGSSMTDVKLQSIRDELTEARKQVDKTRMQYGTEMQRFISREAEVGKYLLQLLICQKNFHQGCLELLNQSVPAVQAMIDEINQPVFGVALADHLKHANVEVAVVIEECVTWLSQHITDEGIFRLSGNAAAIKSIKAAMDIGVPLSEQPNTDTHSVAGVLKQYLRELPEPLLTFDLYNDWMKAAQVPVEERVACIKAVLHRLPKENYKNLCYLMEFLCKLAEHCDVNKMTPSNLGIVIGPNLLWPPDKSANVQSASTQSWLIEMFLLNATELFPEAKCPQLTCGSVSSLTSDLADSSLLGAHTESSDSSSMSSFILGEESPSSGHGTVTGPPSPRLASDNITADNPLMRSRSKKLAPPQSPSPPSPQNSRTGDVHHETYDNIGDHQQQMQQQAPVPDAKIKRQATIREADNLLRQSSATSSSSSTTDIRRSTLTRDEGRLSLVAVDSEKLADLSKAKDARTSTAGEVSEKVRALPTLARVGSVQSPRAPATVLTAASKPRRPPPPPPSTTPAAAPVQRKHSTDADALNPFSGCDDPQSP